MNFNDVKRATRLIAERERLQTQLECLEKISGFPSGYLSYGNNAGNSVNADISKEMQQSIETLLHTILVSQIKQLEIELSTLGVGFEV